jgi:hypothetical protein
MKTPRVDAFVANKKQVPELKSSLDHMPVIEKPQRPSPQAPLSSEQGNPKDESSPQSLSDRPTARPQDEPTGRPDNKRILVRRGFEWYEDQLNALKRLSIQEQLEGKQGSMSAMVREALDDYLKKRTSKK